MFWKRQVPIFIVALIGSITLFGWFIDQPNVKEFIGDDATQWFDVLASFAIILGALNLIKMQIQKVLYQKPGWQYSVIAVLGFIFAIIYYVFERKQTSKSVLYCQSLCLAHPFWMQLHFFAIFMLPVTTFIDLGSKTKPTEVPRGGGARMKKCVQNVLWKRACRPIEPLSTQIASKTAKMVPMVLKEPSKCVGIMYKKTTISFQKSCLLAALLL